MRSSPLVFLPVLPAKKGSAVMAVIVGVDEEKLARKVGDLFVKLHLRVMPRHVGEMLFLEKF
jgi:hypothetical protein